MTKHSRYAGFSIVELMVVVAIMAILAAVAFPSYQASKRKSNRADGIAILNEIMQAQERFAATNGTYTTTMSAIGYVANQPSGEGYYQVNAAACGSGIAVCVNLTATAQAPQDKDDNGNGGDLSLNSRGTKVGW